MLERELTAPRVQLTVGRAQFPRTRIGIVRDSMQYAPRVLHFSAFHIDPSIEWPSTKATSYLLVIFAIVFTVSVVPSILLCKGVQLSIKAMSARKQLAVTAFAEALHSSFKNGLNGTNDFRALAGAPVFIILLHGVVFNIYHVYEIIVYSTPAKKVNQERKKDTASIPWTYNLTQQQIRIGTQ